MENAFKGVNGNNKRVIMVLSGSAVIPLYFLGCLQACTGKGRVSFHTGGAPGLRSGAIAPSPGRDSERISKVTKEILFTWFDIISRKSLGWKPLATDQDGEGSILKAVLFYVCKRCTSSAGQWCKTSYGVLKTIGKPCMILLICRIFFKKDTSELIHKTDSQTLRTA